MDQYSGESQPQAFCLVLLIHDAKTKQVITKKRLYDFEHPLDYLRKRESSSVYSLIFKLNTQVA